MAFSLGFRTFTIRHLQSIFMAKSQINMNLTWYCVLPSHGHSISAYLWGFLYSAFKQLLLLLCLRVITVICGRDGLRPTPEPDVITLHPFFLKEILFTCFQREGRENERKEEKHQCVVVSCIPPTGDPAYNPACALTGNRTGDPLVCRLALNPLIHNSQGIFKIKQFNKLIQVK